MLDELKFPITFTKCPVCGSTNRVAESIRNEQVEKGKMGADMLGSIVQFQTPFFDPRKIALSCPVILSTFDICAECGTFYAIRVDKVDGITKAINQLPQQRPGFVPPQGFQN